MTCRRERRDRRRGFTVLELAVSMTVFAVIAGITTLAVGRAQLTAATSRLDLAVRGELSSLVNTAATADYSTLADQGFARPSACTSNASLSCTTVLGREFEVSWAVTAGTDLTDLSAENPATVVLSATTTLPGNRTVTVKRTIVSPNAGRDATTGVLRVRAEGADYAGPVYLMRPADLTAGETAPQVAATGLITSGVALLRADAAKCTVTAPCTLRLSPTGATRHLDVTMDAASSTGSSSEVVLTADSVAEASIGMRTVPQVRVGLLAVGGTGKAGYPSEKGSVCAWLTFTDDKVSRSVPACNSGSSSSVVFSTYLPAGATAGNEIAIPMSTLMRLTADKPDGTCPSLSTLGQKSWNGSGWVASAECTSWTWGPIGGVISGRSPSGPVGSVSFRPTDLESEYQAVWTSTDLARPATGLAGQPVWSFPRTAQGCAGSASCTTTVSSPEAGSCPTGQCLSGGTQRPYASGPVSSGTWATLSVYAPVGVPTGFVVTVGDSNPAATVSVVARTVPTGVSVVTTNALGNRVYTTLANGTTIASSVASGSTVALSYTAPAATTGVFLELDLTDSSGRTATESVLLWNTRAREKAFPSAGVVRQGKTTRLTVTVTDQAGDPSTDVSAVSAVGPSGSTFGVWTSAGAGALSVLFDAGTAAAGTYDIPVTVGPRSTVTVPVTILPSVGMVTVTATGGRQAGSGAAAATVTDLAGSLMEGADVTFAVNETVTGSGAIGVYASPRGCRTDATGGCATTITIETASAAGSYAAVASSGGVSTTSTPFTVTSTVSRIAGGSITAGQGSTATSNVQVSDGRGQPAGGILLDLSSVPAGVTARMLAATDAGGNSTLEVVVADTAAAGTFLIRATAPGGATSTVPLTVTQVVRTVTAPAVAVPQGGTATVVVTAVDPSGSPVAGVRLDVSGDAQVRAGAAVTTGLDGRAEVALQATTTASVGARILHVTVGGMIVGSIPATIVQGVAGVVVSGDLVRGQSSSITAYLVDGAGVAVPGRAFTVQVDTAAVLPTIASATTDSSGKAVLRFDTALRAATGFARLTFGIDGRSIASGTVVR